jgi:hypothetical protein
MLNMVGVTGFEPATSSSRTLAGLWPVAGVGVKSVHQGPGVSGSRWSR